MNIVYKLPNVQHIFVVSFSLNWICKSNVFFFFFAFVGGTFLKNQFCVHGLLYCTLTCWVQKSSRLGMVLLSLWQDSSDLCSNCIILYLCHCLQLPKLPKILIKTYTGIITIFLTFWVLYIKLWQAHASSLEMVWSGGRSFLWLCC